MMLLAVLSQAGWSQAQDATPMAYAGPGHNKAQARKVPVILLREVQS